MELYLFGTPDAVMQDLLRFREENDLDAYYRSARALLEFGVGLAKCKEVLREYVLCTLMDMPGVGDLMGDAGLAAPYLERDAEAIFTNFFAFDWDAHCEKNGVLPFPKGTGESQDVPWLPLVEAASTEELVQGFQKFFHRFHDRKEARYTAFRWEDGKMRGISRVENFTFDQLAGLRHQKEALLKNAEAFMKGLPAHNVLLVGGSGTGKSSSVKATLNAYADQGMRIVELPKQYLEEFPVLMEKLSRKKCKYIIFIDDLSFEDVDVGYKGLKVALEGQVEGKLNHVLIYVTSNRRHLIKETWKDRDAVHGEIHENDTLHEKMSLSERFGLHLYFSILSQKEYFEVVKLQLSLAGFEFNEDIAKEASAWALTYNGRSGRTARQFVNDYIARHADA